MKISCFTNKLITTPLDDGVRWRLDREFGFTTPLYTVTAPRGFVTDFASIPPLARIGGAFIAVSFLGNFILPNFAWYSLAMLAWMVVMASDSFLHEGVYERAAVIHDYLYSTKKFSRVKSDRILYEAMRHCGTPNWKRRVIYWNVRLFGWAAWNGKKRK